MYKNLKEVVDAVDRDSRVGLVSREVLSGKLRLIVNGSVITLNSFDLSLKPGLVTISSEDVIVVGKELNPVVTIEVPKEVVRAEEVSNGPVLTQEQIVKEVNRKTKKKDKDEQSK